MRVRAILSAAALPAALLLAATPASATHSWAGLHWPRATTLNIRLGDNVNWAWDAYLPVASADWTKAVTIDTTVIQGYRSPYSCQPTYGRVEVCNYRYGYNGWLGIASVWTSSGHIAQATVRLNDTYFASASYNTPAWRRFVMCQEIGHTFGLDHQDETHTNTNLGSCMDYTRDPSGRLNTNGTLSNEHPNAHDYDQLALIYSHTDGWQSRPRGRLPQCSARTSWAGRRVPRARRLPALKNRRLPERTGAASPPSTARVVDVSSCGTWRTAARS